MNVKKSSKKADPTVIVRFRASNALYKQLKFLACEEEMSLAALVKRLALDSLKKFPGWQPSE